jgi:2''-5'' RNA ligase
MGKRLFVSVDLDGLTAKVRAVQERFEGAGGLNVVDPEQAHVTLKFLGEVAEGRVDELTDGLVGTVADSGVGPFTAEFGGLGVFPHLGYISVVWLGVRKGGDELTRLHEATEDRTVAMGFEPEDHEFTPHVTLARMEHAGGKDLVQRVVESQDPDAGRLDVEEVRLTEIVLTDEGPEYRTVSAIPL